MKTRLLKRLRKQAEEYYFITHERCGYVVRSGRGTPVCFKRTFQSAIEACDAFRREDILDEVNLLRKKKRVY